MDHDVVAIAERPDLGGRNDHDVAEARRAEDRTLVTFDVVDHLAIDHDWQRLRRGHPGLIVLAPSVWRAPDEGIGALVRALAARLDRAIEENALEGGVAWRNR